MPSTKIRRTIQRISGLRFHRRFPEQDKPGVGQLRFHWSGNIRHYWSWPDRMHRKAWSFSPELKNAFMLSAQIRQVPRTRSSTSVSYTHLRAHETPEHLVCRLLLE